MSRILFAGALALAMALGSFATPSPAVAGHHETVTQVVTVNVMPGEMEKYLGKVKQLNGIMQRLQASGTVRVWNSTVGGPDTGATIVALEYPNAAAWAAGTAKLQNDSEWRKVIGGLHKIRSLESTAVWRDISPSPVSAPPARPGSVLAITGVQVMPGKLDAYRKAVGSAQSITERLGLSGTLRMWQAEMAGPNTGSVAVGVQYPDLQTYVADQAKLAGDREWQRLMKDLAGMRSLVGRWLYREVTP